ncbi:MAG: dihydrofolate reductase family protein, partial [Planctomycetales bacterium]|nr:dihydrofolate reductase family protein [Planctomycetales bacterium]
LLARLGQQRYTNVLVEGGGKLLGSFFQEQVVDEVHTFVSTRIIGGGSAISPVAGRGVDLVRQATLLETPVCAEVDGDLYVSGIVAR